MVLSFGRALNSKRCATMGPIHERHEILLTDLDFDAHATERIREILVNSSPNARLIHADVHTQFRLCSHPDRLVDRDASEDVELHVVGSRVIEKESELAY